MFFEVLSGLQEETEPLIRLLTRLKVINTPLDPELCPVKSATYLPLDLFKALWGDELKPLMRSAVFGLHLLNLKPEALFNEWQAEMRRYEGVDEATVPSFQRTPSDVLFSKMRQGDLYCKTEFAGKYFWSHFIFPKLKDWHQKDLYPQVHGSQIEGIGHWLNHHQKDLDNIFQLLVQQPTLLAEFMVQVPLDMQPLLLWFAFTRGYPQVVEAIQSACPGALTSLAAIETETGNTLLHYFCIDRIEEGADLLLKLIRDHDLGGYASQPNTEGKTPLELQRRSDRLCANSKIKQLQNIRLYRFFFQYSEPEQITACLKFLLAEESLFDSDCLPLLILGLQGGGSIPVETLQKKYLNYSIKIWQTSKAAYDMKPLLSWMKQFEPLARKIHKAAPVRL
ncbi:hypothetical protein [Endozoicomonas numazuensis]|uniref:Uncharacterized protein n=1 Tax=Endozoicomonas numazuensis TaxID=1137799 RepID=A0A081N6F6_9GAMM|nr:hypothetical protein [Endozoicomonas numazuensis]KEQ14029.1 hypothetical protein GZ78_25660 [Endozoicomonas numazuensis]